VAGLDGREQHHAQVIGASAASPAGDQAVLHPAARSVQDPVARRGTDAQAERDRPVVGS
jgi:hypothetical protein